MNKKIFIFIFVATSVCGYCDENIEKYKIKQGDYLYKIASKYYGDGNKWEIIYKSNSDKIKDPNIIYEGMVIDIPLIVKNKKYEENLNISFPQVSTTVISSELEVEIKKDEKSIKKEDLKTDDEPVFSLNYKIKDKNSLSADFPQSITSFNISQIRVEVEHNFFDGEIKTDGTKNFFVNGEMIEFETNKKVMAFKKLYIYSVVEKTDDEMIIKETGKKITADKVAECEIVDLNAKKCLIIKSDMPVENGMKIKIWN